jgi:glucokinase
MTTVLGVDIGGSHIAAAQVNLSDRSLDADSLVRRSVNAHAPAAEIIAVWADVIEQALARHSKVANKIGIAMPGPFDYERGISLIRDQDKYDALYGMNVKELLAESLRLEVSAIRLLNDAGCFLGGEVFGGAAQGFERAIGLTLGTGLGTATYANGQASDAALWQAPFREGIAEDYISARWFVQRYHALSGKRLTGVREIADLYAQDPGARAVFDEFGETLAEFLNFFIEKEDPEVVVIGGNIARAYGLFAEKLKEYLKFPSVAIRIASLGEEAILLGAASDWKEPDALR